MNSNTTTQGLAGAATGVAGAATAIFVWVLTTHGVTVPPEITAAIGVLVAVAAHYIAVLMSAKDVTNVPVQVAPAPVSIPVATIPPAEPVAPPVDVAQPVPLASLSASRKA